MDTKSQSVGPVILLVEDDESIREFYARSLIQARYQVLEASDGIDGFALFQTQKIDLILSDLRMPRMDGLELVARIRQSGSQIPIILCSGFYTALEHDLAKSEIKVDRVLDKPFKVKDMVEAIDDLLQRQRSAS